MFHLVPPENMDVDDDDLFKHSTTLTNKQRGNEVSVRPATLDCKHLTGKGALVLEMFPCLGHVKLFFFPPTSSVHTSAGSSGRGFTGGCTPQ